MKKHNVAIGQFYISNNPDDIISTSALGSCIGLAMYDVHCHTAGLAHIQLPDSSLNRALANVKPACFADRAIAVMLEKFENCNILTHNLIISIAGGASTQGEHNFNFFHVGEKNIKAVHSCLQQYQLSAQDIGGHLPRSMSIDVVSGSVEISSFDNTYTLNLNHEHNQFPRENR